MKRRTKDPFPDAEDPTPVELAMIAATLWPHIREDCETEGRTANRAIELAGELWFRADEHIGREFRKPLKEES